MYKKIVGVLGFIFIAFWISVPIWATSSTEHESPVGPIIALALLAAGLVGFRMGKSYWRRYHKPWTDKDWQKHWSDDS